MTRGLAGCGLLQNMIYLRDQKTKIFYPFPAEKDKWTVDKTKSLITMSEERETCTRCGKRRLIVHSMFGDFVEGVDKIKED